MVTSAEGSSRKKNNGPSSFIGFTSREHRYCELVERSPKLNLLLLRPYQLSTNHVVSFHPAEEDHDHHLLRHPRRRPRIDHWRHAGLLGCPTVCCHDDRRRPTDSQQRRNSNDNTKTWNNQLERNKNLITDKREHHRFGRGTKKTKNTTSRIADLSKQRKQKEETNIYNRCKCIKRKKQQRG